MENSCYVSYELVYMQPARPKDDPISERTSPFLKHPKPQNRKRLTPKPKFQRIENKIMTATHMT